MSACDIVDRAEWDPGLGEMMTGVGTVNIGKTRACILRFFKVLVCARIFVSKMMNLA